MKQEAVIRRAVPSDLDGVANLYDKIMDVMEVNNTTGWQRGVYPTRKTAEDALKREDLFVLEDEGILRGTALINQIQVDVYENAPWKHQTEPEDVMVIHTLVIDPETKGKGYGSAFIQYYEEYARSKGCRELRMDTNQVNAPARALYAKLGYEEITIVPTVFNGIPGVNLVLLEKYIGESSHV